MMKWIQSKFSAFKSKVKRKLFHWLFEVDPNILLEVYHNQLYLEKQQQTLFQFITSNKQSISELSSMSGGPGWVQTVQNAIMKLDDRLEGLETVVIQHHDNLSIIVEERQQLQELAHQSTKKELN